MAWKQPSLPVQVVQAGSGSDFVSKIVNYAGKAWVYVPPGSYYLPANTVHVPDYSWVWGAGKDKTIIYPNSNPGVSTPLLAFDKYAGTDSCQQQCWWGNLSVNTRLFANSIPFGLYNLKMSRFDMIKVQEFQTYAFDIEGHSASGYCFWDRFFDIESGNSTVVANRELFHVTAYNLDCIIDTVLGDAKGGYGFHMLQGSGWQVNRMWLTGIASLIYLDGNTGDVSTNRFVRCTCDTPTGDAFYLKCTNAHNISRNEFQDCDVIAVPANMDIFHFIGNAGGAFSRNTFTHNRDGGGSVHKYIAEWDGVGTFYNTNKFIDNILTAGASGGYSNIPTSSIIDDYADHTKYYQTQAGGAWVNPTWVGTAREGEDTLTVYNSNLGQYRIYSYANAGWRYVSLT